MYGLDLVSATDNAGAETYFLYDGLGSTANVTSGSGTTLTSYSYDAFGAVRSQSAPHANYWLLTGEQRDSGSNLYYLRARYYDPAIGRFLSRDPVLGGNLYAYVRNNPTNLVDPYGLIGVPKIKIPNPKEIIQEVVEPIVNTTGNIVSEGATAVGSVVESTFDFLSSCEGKLLAGGLIMIAAGVSMVGLYYLSASAALAAGTEVGLHAAVQLGWIGGGGALLGVYGFASVMDACMDGPDQRFFARGGGEERPKE